MLRVSPSQNGKPGARSFALEYSYRGRNKRLTLGPVSDGKSRGLTITEARVRARAEYASFLAGHDPQGQRAAQRGAGLTIATLCDQMLSGVVLRPSTRSKWAWTVAKLIKPHLGTARAASVTRADLRAWLERIAIKSAYSADTAFRVLRRAYSYAVERDDLPGTPFAHLQRPFAGQLRESDRVLSPDELALLLGALDDLPGQYADATRLLLYTGVRRESVIGMRWDELDLAAGLWIVPATRSKSGRQHTVPLSPAAVEILKRQRRRREAVFPPARGRGDAMQWSSRFIRALQMRMEVRAYAAKHRKDVPPAPPPASSGLAWPTYPRTRVPRWRIHDLRHTVATTLIERLGVDRDLVRLILGHAAPAGATRVYDRAERVEDRRRALIAWADWLAALPVPPGRVWGAS